MTLVRRWFVAARHPVIASCVFCLLDSSVDATDGARRPTYTSVCGPRCAQYVLRLLGKNIELHELVDELQTRPLKYGSSMLDIAAALRRRGLSTCAVSVDPAALVASSVPMIVHLPGEGPRGHFVVQLPTTDDAVADWWMPEGYVHRLHAQDAASMRSGAMLLVSSMPIQPKEHLAVRAATERAPILSNLLLALPLLLSISAALALVSKNRIAFARVIQFQGVKKWRLLIRPR